MTPTPRVPFVDLPGQVASLRSELDQAISKVLGQCDFILGAEVGRFEEEFAAYIGTRHCVAVASGTDALHLGLVALGIGPGDEVLTVPNSFVASALAVSYTGATPAFVDVRLEDQLMDVALVEGAITARTAAILPVHLFGQACDLGPLVALAESRGIPIIEDCCQAHGARYGERRVGSFGKLSAFSFYPGKNLGAFGDGGAVCTDDDELASRVRQLRNYGSPVKYRHDHIGFNSRLDTLQATILRVKLPHLDRWNEARRAAALRYRARLSPAGILGVPENVGRTHVRHLEVVRVPARDQVKEMLQREGIETGVHYPVPIHLQPAYAGLGLGPASFPMAEQLASEVLSLPMFPEITEPQIDRVAASLVRALQETSGSAQLQPQASSGRDRTSA